MHLKASAKYEQKKCSRRASGPFGRYVLEMGGKGLKVVDRVPLGRFFFASCQLEDTRSYLYIAVSLFEPLPLFLF